MIPISLDGKVALVTGASRGIGRAIAETLGRAGAKVACLATTEERASTTVKSIGDSGGEAAAYGCDVSDTSAVNEVVDRVLAEHGGVDVLVNNAGITRDGLLARMSREDWDAVIATNLTGTFNVTRALTRNFLRKRGGRIINVGSAAGKMGNAGQANYAASKGGVVAFTLTLARELGSRNVLVNCVQPGFVNSDMARALGDDVLESVASACPLRRAGEPAEIAGAVLWLASDLSSFVTGAVINVDGGMAM